LELELSGEGGVWVDNDAWNAHAGGLTGRPGILLISGTGSPVLGAMPKGKPGGRGLGYLLQDLGSAHALGLDAMIAPLVMRMAAADDRSDCQPAAGACLGDIKEIFRRVHHPGLTRRR